MMIPYSGLLFWATLYTFCTAATHLHSIPPTWRQ